jgi:integrase
MTTTASHGAATRRPVYSGNRRVQGLWERRLADGTWVFDAALRVAGKVKRHTLSARTKTDAIAEIGALRVDYQRGESYRSPAAALTLADLGADWLVHITARIGHPDPRLRYSARTVELYEQHLEQYINPRLGHKPPALTLLDVRRFVDELGAIRWGSKRQPLAPSTVSGIISTLSGLIRFGVKSELVDRNVVHDLDRDDRPGVARQTEPRYLPMEEAVRLLAHMGDTFRPVAATLLYSAGRCSEPLGLRWRELDFKALTISYSLQLGSGRSRGQLVPLKTPASEATVPMLPALARELLAHRSRQASKDLRLVRPDALVFTTSTGKPQSRRNVHRAVRAAADACGLNGEGREPVSPQDLRHTYTSIAIIEGSLPEGSKLARHANARVTAQMYAGITEGGLEVAAAKMVDAGFGA